MKSIISNRVKTGRNGLDDRITISMSVHEAKNILQNHCTPLYKHLTKCILELEKFTKLDSKTIEGDENANKSIY